MLFSKSLKFVEPETGQADPFSSAKFRLIQKLETQLRCAEAMVKGESYTVPGTKTVTEDDGTKKTININHAPRHWYWRDKTGNVRFCVRVFNKRIEFEPGKTDVLVSKDAELPKTVKAVLEAANAGEFDPHIKKALTHTESTSTGNQCERPRPIKQAASTLTRRKKSDISKPLSSDSYATQKDLRPKWPFWIGTGGRFPSESVAVFIGMRRHECGLCLAGGLSDLICGNSTGEFPASGLFTARQ